MNQLRSSMTITQTMGDPQVGVIMDKKEGLMGAAGGSTRTVVLMAKTASLNINVLIVDLSVTQL